MNKVFILPFLCFSFFTYAQNYSIEKWFEGKASATVMTYDDWGPGSGNICVPGLLERGLTGTFFVTIGNVGWGPGRSWEHVDTAFMNGLEIANHTVRHSNLSEATIFDINKELVDCEESIKANTSVNKLSTIAYPYGAFDQDVKDVTKKYYIAGRKFDEFYDKTFQYEFASTEDDYYEVDQVALDSRIPVDTFARWVQHGVDNNGLMIFSMHSVGTNGWGNNVLSEGHYLSYLDTLVGYTDQTWVTTFEKSIKYHREVHCATLTLLSSSDNEDFYELTDTLSNNEVYNQELTLKVEIPQGEYYTSAKQNGQEIKLWKSEDEKYAYINAVPDQGEIVINKSGFKLSFITPKNQDVFDTLSLLDIIVEIVSEKYAMSKVTFQVDGEDVPHAYEGNIYNISFTPDKFENYFIEVFVELSNGKIYSDSVEVFYVDYLSEVCYKRQWLKNGFYRTGDTVTKDGYTYKLLDINWNWINPKSSPDTSSYWEKIDACINVSGLLLEFKIIEETEALIKASLYASDNYSKEVMLKMEIPDGVSFVSVTQNGNVQNNWISDNGKYLYYSVIPNGGEIVFLKEKSVLGTISSVLSSKEYTIYPNPVNDRLNVSNLLGDELLTVIDVSGGVQIKGYELSDESIVRLQSGIYILLISNEETVKQYTFVKE